MAVYYMNNVRIPFPPIMSISVGIVQAILFLEAGLQVSQGFLHHKDSIVSHKIWCLFLEPPQKLFCGNFTLAV